MLAGLSGVGLSMPNVFTCRRTIHLLADLGPPSVHDDVGGDVEVLPGDRGRAVGREVHAGRTMRPSAARPVTSRRTCSTAIPRPAACRRSTRSIRGPATKPGLSPS